MRRGGCADPACAFSEGALVCVVDDHARTYSKNFRVNRGSAPGALKVALQAVQRSLPAAVNGATRTSTGTSTRTGCEGRSFEQQVPDDRSTI